MIMITFIFVLGIDLMKEGPWDNRHRVSWSIASVYRDIPRDSHYY